MIILLDLNFTLVTNSHEKLVPFTRQIYHEQYSQELIDHIKKKTVILVTARPAMHREATLKSIKEKTGWLPHDAYFNEWNLFPPACKKRALETYIIPQYGDDLKRYLAIESNPKTRAMYIGNGIRAVTRDQALTQTIK